MINKKILMMFKIWVYCQFTLLMDFKNIIGIQLYSYIINDIYNKLYAIFH